VILNQGVRGKESEFPENQGKDDKAQMQSGAENVHLFCSESPRRLCDSCKQKHQKTLTLSHIALQQKYNAWTKFFQSEVNLSSG
jgi:hypothetical protein